MLFGDKFSRSAIKRSSRSQQLSPHSRVWWANFGRIKNLSNFHLDQNSTDIGESDIDEFAKLTELAAHRCIGQPCWTISKRSFQIAYLANREIDSMQYWLNRIDSIRRCGIRSIRLNDSITAPFDHVLSINLPHTMLTIFPAVLDRNCFATENLYQSRL